MGKVMNIEEQMTNGHWVMDVRVRIRNGHKEMNKEWTLPN